MVKVLTASSTTLILLPSEEGSLQGYRSRDQGRVFTFVELNVTVRPLGNCW